MRTTFELIEIPMDTIDDEPTARVVYIASQTITGPPNWETEWWYWLFDLDARTVAKAKILDPPDLHTRAYSWRGIPTQGQVLLVEAGGGTMDGSKANYPGGRAYIFNTNSLAVEGSTLIQPDPFDTQGFGYSVTGYGWHEDSKFSYVSSEDSTSSNFYLIELEFENGTLSNGPAQVFETNPIGLTISASGWSHFRSPLIQPVLGGRFLVISYQGLNIHPEWGNENEVWHVFYEQGGSGTGMFDLSNLGYAGAIPAIEDTGGYDDEESDTWNGTRGGWAAVGIGQDHVLILRSDNEQQFVFDLVDINTFEIVDWFWDSGLAYFNAETFAQDVITKWPPARSEQFLEFGPVAVAAWINSAGPSLMVSTFSVSGGSLVKTAHVLQNTDELFGWFVDYTAISVTAVRVGPNKMAVIVGGFVSGNRNIGVVFLDIDGHTVTIEDSYIADSAPSSAWPAIAVVKSWESVQQ